MKTKHRAMYRVTERCIYGNERVVTHTSLLLICLRERLVETNCIG